MSDKTQQNRVPLDKPLDYISRQEAIEALRICELGEEMSIIEIMPSADVVPRSILEQVKWERGVAMKQLEDLGIGFGEEVKDVVKVVRCKDCKHSEHWYRDKARCFLWYESGIDVWEDGYCSYGGRRTDAPRD